MYITRLVLTASRCDSASSSQHNTSVGTCFPADIISVAIGYHFAITVWVMQVQTSTPDTYLLQKIDGSQGIAGAHGKRWLHGDTLIAQRCAQPS